MHRGGLILILALVAAACSSGAEPTTTTTAPSTSTTTTTTTTIPEPTDEEIENAAIFLLSVDESLAGTIHEGSPFEDPESFLSIGRLFCDLLDTGMAADDVLAGYVAAILVQYPDEELAEDDLILGGAVLGAATVVLCPEYEESL